MTKIKEIEVPTAIMQEVAEKIEISNLHVRIIGRPDDSYETILVEVSYDSSDRSAVHDLEDFIEDQWDELDAQNEEEEDEDEDE